MLSIKLFRWSSVCFGLIKTSNSLFQNKPKETKKNGKTLNFLKKYQNMLPIELFWLVFCLFRFNRNIETLCFGIEAIQPKQNVLFRIVLKLVSVSFSVVSNRK
jgi:hypothetical protein